MSCFLIEAQNSKLSIDRQVPVSEQHGGNCVECGKEHLRYCIQSLAMTSAIPLARCVQDVADLALIAPGILDAVTLGEQPGGLATDCLIKTSFPVVWSEQQAQFAAL